MYCLFGTSLPKGVFLLLSFEHSAFRHSACPLIDQTEYSGCCILNHILTRCLQQSTCIFPTPLRVLKNEWMVYVVMNQDVWILEVKDIWCNSHVNNHVVPLHPKATHLNMQAPFCTPYIYEDALQASVQFKAMQQRQKAQKDLYLKFFNPEQSNWNITEVSVVGHAIVTDAQNTMFPYVQIHTSIFFGLNAEKLHTCYKFQLNI